MFCKCHADLLKEETLSETEVTLIPTEFSSLAQEAPKVTEAISQVERLTLQLEPLKAEARSLEVKHPDREAYQRIGQILTEVRGLKKQGEAHMSPFSVLVERVRTFLQNATQKHTNACTMIEADCIAKMKPWEQAELEATAAEQKQQNKAAAKAGSVAPTVKHDIPRTAGYRRSTTYHVVVEDIPKFLRASKTDKELRQYITLDEQALGAEARQMKDVAAFEKRFPGVKCIKD